MNKKYILPVLMYHSIIKDKSDAGKHNIYVTEENLRKQLQYLKKNDYQTITFRDIKEGKIKDFYKKIILTFDDGYEDNYTLLFPLLKEFDFTAVIYLVTQKTYNTWGVAEGEPKKNFLSKEQIMEMDNYGIEMGGHTRTHRSLKDIPASELVNEIKGCKEDIEKMISNKVVSFAYPFGALNDEVKQVVKESGIDYGIATKSGPIDLNEDPFQIRRINISTSTGMFVFKHKVSGTYHTKKYILF